jgi:hypothetical protein
MAQQNGRPAVAGVHGEPEVDCAGTPISSPDNSPQADRQLSKWRKKYKVHPAADVFPMMSDEDLAKLGEDIKANGLKIPTLLWGDPPLLIDGRNRLEAMERVGVKLDPWMTEHFHCATPVAHMISLNIRRRHLTKQQQADLIVAAHKAAADPSPSWRGVSPDPAKAAAVATAKEHGISKRMVERSLAKADGRKPKSAKPLHDAERVVIKAGRLTIAQGLEAARRHYLFEIESIAEKDWAFALDAEMEIVVGALREIAGKRALQTQAADTDDLGNIPEGLDRRCRP